VSPPAFTMAPPVPLASMPGVVGPVHGVGRAGCPGQVGRGRAGVEEDLVLLLGDLVHGQRHDESSARRRSRRPCRRRYHWRAMLEPTSGLFWWSAETTRPSALDGGRNPRPPSAPRGPSPAGEVGIEAGHVVSTPILTLRQRSAPGPPRWPRPSDRRSRFVMQQFHFMFTPPE
jgi:hypothetical protein